MDRARARDDDRPGRPDDEATTPGRPPRFAARAATVLALAFLLGFVALRGRELWAEWRSLRGAERAARANAIIGYKNVRFDPSYASKPADWYHDQGEHTMLWAGWKDNAHRWFRVGRGDVPREKLSTPIGRDATQAIDVPIFETDGEPIWRNVPDEAGVGGVVLGDEPRVYPFLLMDKVEVVNDSIGGRPVLVEFCRETTRPASVAVYEATLEGRRITMGSSGYTIEGHPLLYDRGTESLWVARGDGLAAIAGIRKGASLRRIARAETVAWGDWRARHPGSRLLVGADRRRAAPAE